MIAFNCDYNEGAHPRILEALIETNMEQTAGYGGDQYCREAEIIIKGLCQSPEAKVHFMVGGTQANLTVISSVLRPHQAALCAVSGHINVHETGAIEACGHKVMTVPSEDGKISALHKNDSSFEHTTQPKLVYISNPTELGTIYTKKEVEELRAACDECGMYLYLDGARLGYGLCAENNDLDLESIAKNCDVFYIGGTKVGALFGELPDRGQGAADGELVDLLPQGAHPIQHLQGLHRQGQRVRRLAHRHGLAVPGDEGHAQLPLQQLQVGIRHPEQVLHGQHV